MSYLSSLSLNGQITLSGTPEGVDAWQLVRMARDTGARICADQQALLRGVLPVTVFIARDDVRLVQMQEMLRFFAPDLEVLVFPAWDCQPYDRVSPNIGIVGQRLACLSALHQMKMDQKFGRKTPIRIILTTVSAITQRVLPPEIVTEQTHETVKVNQQLDPEDLTRILQRKGYMRTDAVHDPGEYAVRGGILDIYSPVQDHPVRLDFFGDTLETIRQFDPLTQRSDQKCDQAVFYPVREVGLNLDSIQNFRTNYRKFFGSISSTDPLYEAISAHRYYGGMEHWLPLFYDKLATFFDYVPEAPIIYDTMVAEALKSRWETILDTFDARQMVLKAANEGEGPAYFPIPPDLLYLSEADWQAACDIHSVVQLVPYDHPDKAGQVYDQQGRSGRNFSDIRMRAGADKKELAEMQDSLFLSVIEHIIELQDQHKQAVILLSAQSEGSAARLKSLLDEAMIHQKNALPVDIFRASHWQDCLDIRKRQLPLVILPVERGVVSPDLIILTEQDILGDRLARPVAASRKRKADQFIADIGDLSEGDYVVHIDHGIGQYLGLQAIDVGGAPHDCLSLIYDGGDKLFVPVENMDVLSRYGSGGTHVHLDRLGGGAWQAKRAKVKERIREIADQLIAVAAQRELRKGEKLIPAEGIYDEFSARFPYTETEDQLRVIDETVTDLASGKPMDRLVCGDVGFGKTEVALRAAFVAVMSGVQVAVVVPTTILARQHYRNFSDRFKDWPVRVAQLSRMVSPKDTKLVRDELAKGQVDILVGTHAVLAAATKFKSLGLLIIDEEQHFGVKQKEKLKQLRTDLHVLTLTATPIPRTLQQAMSGIREMSIIATPPVDRLAIRTFVSPYDSVMVREAIMREHFRGGQIFYVCPRLKDLPKVQEKLEKLVPEIKIAVAHGKLSAQELDEVMNGFYDGAYDLLLSTNIVESGLDVPRANTMILHRADMFGLAQLYQLRGRIGRSKIRAYCYMTYEPTRKLTKDAQRRLDVMQTLDSLGAGFNLASHDLDIRGAGNLLGDEQSGHIKEVGVELYQQMLEEAVASAKELGEIGGEDQFSPQINLGMAVLIPENYVADLSLRLSLYRRLSEAESSQEIEAFAAEMIDRFGPLPDEVENLLKLVEIKRLCRLAGVQKFDAGPKGIVITFYKNIFANPDKLILYVAKQGDLAKLRPDQKLVFQRNWPDIGQRVKNSIIILRNLAKLAK